MTDLTPEAREKARKIAHVLLDLMASIDEDNAANVPSNAPQMIWASVEDLDADFTDVVRAMIMLLEPAILITGRWREEDRLTAIGTLRELLDRVQGPDADRS